MIKETNIKMPNATFYCFDFNDELSAEIRDSQFDFIISSYAIHHVNDESKLELIEQLSVCLKSG